MRERLSVDDARLRPHLRARERDGYRLVDRKRLLAEQVLVLREAVADPPARKVPTGDDPERLRGLPMIARGVRGAQRGTDPLAEAIRRDSRRRVDRSYAEKV